MEGNAIDDDVDDDDVTLTANRAKANANLVVKIHLWGVRTRLASCARTNLLVFRTISMSNKFPNEMQIHSIEIECCFVYFFIFIFVHFIRLL